MPGEPPLSLFHTLAAGEVLSGLTHENKRHLGALADEAYVLREPEQAVQWALDIVHMYPESVPEQLAVSRLRAGLILRGAQKIAEAGIARHTAINQYEAVDAILDGRTVITPSLALWFTLDTDTVFQNRKSLSNANPYDSRKRLFAQTRVLAQAALCIVERGRWYGF